MNEYIIILLALNYTIIVIFIEITPALYINYLLFGFPKGIRSHNLISTPTKSS